FPGRFAGFRIKSDVRSVLAATNYITVAVDACGLSKRALRRQPVKITALDDEAADVAKVDSPSGYPASIGDAVEPRGARRAARVFYVDLVKHPILPGEGVVIKGAYYFQRIVNTAGDRSFKSSWKIQPTKSAVAQAQETMQFLVTVEREKAHNITVVVDPMDKRVVGSGKVDGLELLIGQFVTVSRMTVDGVRPDDAAEVVDARGIRGHGAGKTDFHEIKGRLGLSKCAAQSNAHHQKTSNLTVHGRPLEGCCRRPAALRGTLRIDAVTWFRGIWVKQTKSSKQS